MLYDIVLERWFKNGSQRYSVDNLGDVEIVPLSFSEQDNSQTMEMLKEKNNVAYQFIQDLSKEKSQ